MQKSQIPTFILSRMQKRAGGMAERILPYLKNSKTIIDVGCGNCFVAKQLQDNGKKVTAVDIKNQSLEESVNVTTWDGVKLPFKDKSFDTGILLTVMHHTPNPTKIFREVARVSKEIIVIETSYRTVIEKICIVLFDSLLNAQLDFHWSSYRSDSDWRKLFISEGYTIIKSEKHFDPQIMTYYHPLYYLRKS